MLTARQIERFHTDGYLLVEDVFRRSAISTP